MRDAERAIAGAAVAATVAFAVYARTLLPGVDLGDTGGFQAAVLWPETSARQAYPLYYALARPFVEAVGASQPARTLNLFSALCGGLAVGLLTYLGARITRSALAGAAAALLLAVSYTFWSQAIIAEVYTLHLALVAACLIALQAFAVEPSTRRLAVFFMVYALAFGNHLTMILLLVPFAIFLLQVHPRRAELLRPQTIAMAVAIAAAAALLYAPGFLWVWTHVDAPAGWRGRVAAFWFDTTKADWRDAMVFGVAEAELRERVAMWLWDARQQFGAVGIAVAVAGAIRAWFLSRPWALLLWTAYAISTVFALTYNVGDPHVFFLTGHLLTALAAAIAVRPAPGTRAGSALAVALLLYAGWRAWDTWPRADRHDDRRADLLVARLTAGLDDSTAVLLSQMEWQSENALLYTGRYERRSLAWARLADVLPRLPFFVRDNHRLGRDVALTAGAAADVIAAYGPLFPVVEDGMVPSPPLLDTVRRIPRGAPYVLTLLTPTRDVPLDTADFDAALEALTAGGAPRRGTAHYQVWSGLAGEAPSHHREFDRPETDAFSLAGDRFTIRIDGWVPLDTFRRGGYGRVLHGRDPLLTVERGASLVWLNGDSSARVVYSGGLYAPARRFRIPAVSPQQVAGTAGAMLRRARLP